MTILETISMVVDTMVANHNLEIECIKDYKENIYYEWCKVNNYPYIRDHFSI